MSTLSLLQPTRTADELQEHMRYPRSESEWQERYAWLRAAYSMEPYTLEDRQAWHLFEALDDNQEEIARTVRLLRDFAFIIDSNADALFGGGLDLDVADSGSPADLTRAEAIWKRSKMLQNLSTLAHNVALGRCGLEVQRLPRAEGSLDYQTIIVVHPPETYLTVYDDQSRTELTKVVIVDKFFSEDDLDENGNPVKDATLHVYRREITATKTTTTLDGEPIPSQTGPHSAGRVPFVNLVFRATREPEHGQSAAAGIEPALALADSMFTQSHATGARFADPKMLAKGVDLSGTKAGHFGRVVQWAPQPGVDSEITYLEPSMQGVKAILETIDRLLEQARATFPEFALFRAGSNASGEALKTLGQGFERKITSARANILTGIAEAVGIAVAIEQGRPYDDDSNPFVVKAGPVLPVDLQQEVDLAATAVGAGLLTRRDAIRRLQVVGLIGPQHDPDEYAAEAEDQSATGARKFFTSSDGDPNA